MGLNIWFLMIYFMYDLEIGPIYLVLLIHLQLENEDKLPPHTPDPFPSSTAPAFEVMQSIAL